MKHIIITRINFNNDELFQKYFEVSKKYYIPSINSQTNKDFTLGLSVKSHHLNQIRDLIDPKIEIIQFNNVKDEYRKFVNENNFQLQTRHDCDDYMSPDYIEFLQKKTNENKERFENFIITFQPKKLDFNNGNEYKHGRDYSKVCSMFSTLYQKIPKNGIMDVMHDDLRKITNKVFYFGEGHVKLVIHENNQLSKL